MEANVTMPDESQARELATKEQMLDPSIVQKKRSRKRNITIFVVVGILNVGLLIALVMLLVTPSQQASNNASTAGSGNSAMLGKQAPDLTLATANGTQKVPFSHYKGTPVVINFWASWCQPCQDETPFLQKNVSKLQAQGVKFISVDAGESLSVVEAFNKKYGVAYTSVIDTVTGNTAIDYGVTTFPMTFFVDRQGTIKATCNTSLNDASFKNGLDKITS